MAWTHEIAWAAGFFDGEGSTYRDPNPRLCVVQNDERVLLRFQKAVLGMGKLKVNTKTYGRAKKPVHTLRVTGWRDVQTVVALLWKYLSPQKREQATRVLMGNLERMSTDPKLGSNAPRGTRACGVWHEHPVSQCRACHRVYEARYRKRRKVGQ